MVIYRGEPRYEDFVYDIRNTAGDLDRSDSPNYSVWYFKTFDNYEPTIANLIVYDYQE